MTKIQSNHLEKPAYIYIRQSTMAQVRHHQESTERQYALRAMALELGWSESAIRTLDRDLGMTGTEMTRREDFKTLVADVSMGQVGAVFALEVSRLPPGEAVHRSRRSPISSMGRGRRVLKACRTP